MSVCGSDFTGLAGPGDKTFILPIVRSRRSQHISYIDNMSITFPDLMIYFQLHVIYLGKNKPSPLYSIGLFDCFIYIVTCSPPTHQHVIIQ